MITPRLNIRFIKTAIHSFHFFGAIGFFLGLFLGMWLAYTTGLSIVPVVLCSLIGAGVLFGLTYLYKIFTGREDLVYYQHEIAILICSLIALNILNLSVLKYLDITIMGIGVFLVFGRIGCFSVGCCHGRIGKHGVIYTDAHVTEGFHKYFAGIPIFPIQLVESCCVLVTVLIGTYTILKGYLPGTALLLYTVIYGAVRFVLEYYRGDTERPYWLGFSEAQWTTFGIFVVSVILSLLGLLPYYAWHLLSLPILVLAMVAAIVYHKFQTIPTYELLHPKHILEIAQGIEALENHTPINGEIFMVSTSLGLNISRGISTLEEELVVHYTISGINNKADKKEKKFFKVKVNKDSVTLLGELIQLLKHPREKIDIVEVKPDIFHLIFPYSVTENINLPQASISNALNLRRNLRNRYN
jgi:prolipoprotein diacylglyceryltransferase